MAQSLFRVEWRRLAALGPITPEWRDLASRVLEPNVFYEPAFALAAAPVFGRDSGAGLVWSGATPARLVGLFPAGITLGRYGVPLRVLVGWTHPYGPLGTPLVDAEAGEAAIAAWLDYLAIDAKMPKLMLMPSLATEGPFAQAIERALARRRGRSALFGRHARAQLAPSGDRSRYVEMAIERKKLKELRRQLRRLEDAGAVSFRMANEPGSLAQSLGDFLRLEAAGWKGRAGSAAGDNPDLRWFMEAVVSGLGGEAKARIAGLYLNDRAIASLILLQSKDTVWTWKIAYDEAFARASPGVQLMLHATTTLLEDRTLARADSCAIANHPMIDHIWRERLPVADRLIHVGPHGSVAFPLAAALEATRRAAIALAKRGLRLFRR
jgi:CelD/BcsL family acetyltransferase involved in cellulose biosynthesis